MSEALDAERCRRLLAEARADPEVHQAVLDAPPIPPEVMARIRQLIPPLGAHRLRDDGDGGEPDGTP